MEPLYQPTANRLMRVVAMFSGSASSLQYLIERDPNLGAKYQFAGAFTDKKNASGIELARSAKIPVEIHDYREYVSARSAKFSDMGVRDEYFREVADIVDQWKPDIIMQSGFMLITTISFLSHFKYRVLNVHPADLSILDDLSRRKYTGLHVVERALADGALETRSTVHIVTEGVDEGPIIVRSEPLPVEPGTTATRHQEKMK